MVTYIFRVENRTAETVFLEAKAHSTQGWPLLGPTGELVLAPGGEAYVVCSLLVPATVTAGTAAPWRRLGAHRKQRRGPS